jgi:hypothetical protein
VWVCSRRSDTRCRNRTAFKGPCDASRSNLGRLDSSPGSSTTSTSESCAGPRGERQSPRSQPESRCYCWLPPEQERAATGDAAPRCPIR